MSPISRYKILSIDRSVPEIGVYRIQHEDKITNQFAPGQAVFLHILDENGASIEKKPYSVASAPGVPYIELCIKLVNGKLTGKLEKLGIGAVVGIEGPMGHFVYGGQTRAVFIGGGTGVAPFMSMLRSVASKKLPGEFILFYSVKDRENIIYREELEQIQKNNPNIKVVITLTKEERGENWNGEYGRINKEMLERHVPKASTFDWWICGPAELVKNMRISITELGADVKKLHMEAWG
ncbi:FAD-dependent oxidoreductase [Candidatus Micrarchaeota archaeon]|nr:FAD-dependent oxidoreductase [Candidatus Micrarchaeota archaeon]